MEGHIVILLSYRDAAMREARSQVICLQSWIGWNDS